MWIKYVNHTRHQTFIKVCLAYKGLNSCHLCWHHASFTANRGFVFQRFHRWKTSFITITAQHGDSTWGESEIQQKINRHAKVEPLPSANTLGVSGTTMLLPLNIINHIRKDTCVEEENNCKLIDDPSLTSQNNSEDVDSNSVVEAPPTLEEHHSSPVQ